MIKYLSSTRFSISHTVYACTVRDSHVHFLSRLSTLQLPISFHFHSFSQPSLSLSRLSNDFQMFARFLLPHSFFHTVIVIIPTHTIAWNVSAVDYCSSKCRKKKINFRHENLSNPSQNHDDDCVRDNIISFSAILCNSSARISFNCLNG